MSDGTASGDNNMQGPVAEVLNVLLDRAPAVIGIVGVIGLSVSAIIWGREAGSIVVQGLTNLVMAAAGYYFGQKK